MANEITAGMTGLTLRTNLNEVIEESNLYELREFYRGKNVVWIGDSITAQGDDEPNSWILTLCTLMDWTYVVGNNMGVAGSGLLPYNNLGAVGDNSIYKRCDDVAAKSPDVIFLTGGENDDINSTITLTEAAYTGATIPTGDPSTPGIIGAVKGCLKKLRDGSPNAKIILQTNFLTSSYSDSNAQKKLDRHWAFRQVAPLYGASYINNLEVGITPNVHPTADEGEVWGRWIARKMYSV